MQSSSSRIHMLHPSRIAVACLRAAGIASIAAAGGCNAVLAPAGPVADAEHVILLNSLAVMLAIVVPTILVTLACAYWFRASNAKARHRPDWSYSGRLELIVWSIPALVILFLGGIAWIGSHDLDPAKPLESSIKPLEVQVVSLDWKWLFIYPEKQVASLNELFVPFGTPIHFRITSATVMNVFFVPQLGSQIYSMNGMESQLYLQADKPGDYPGLSGHFSGDGFSDMAFNVRAVPATQFAEWLSSAHASGKALDEAAYRALLEQDVPARPSAFGSVAANLFDDIVAQKLPPGDGPGPRPSLAASHHEN